MTMTIDQPDDLHATPESLEQQLAYAEDLAAERLLTIDFIRSSMVNLSRVICNFVGTGEQPLSEARLRELRSIITFLDEIAESLQTAE